MQRACLYNMCEYFIASLSIAFDSCVQTWLYLISVSLSNYLKFCSEGNYSFSVIHRDACAHTNTHTRAHTQTLRSTFCFPLSGLKGKVHKTQWVLEECGLPSSQRQDKATISTYWNCLPRLTSHSRAIKPPSWDWDLWNKSDRDVLWAQERECQPSRGLWPKGWASQLEMFTFCPWRSQQSQNT